MLERLRQLLVPAHEGHGCDMICSRFSTRTCASMDRGPVGDPGSARRLFCRYIKLLNKENDDEPETWS
jgi:hypothetical protein